MTYGKLLSGYQKTSIDTSSKLDLVILCYDKTIEFLAQAKNYHEDKEFEKKSKSFSIATGLINELQSNLNIEEGGEIAKNLDSIYSYLTKRLIQGDIEKDLTAFDEAMQILMELRGAWEQIASGDEDLENNVIAREEEKPHFSQVSA